MHIAAHHNETSSRTAYGPFLGWRRKTGGITLILACALMLAFLRGHLVADSYYFGNGIGPSFICLSSTHSGLTWRRVNSNGAMMWRPGWVSYRIPKGALVDPDEMNPEFAFITIRQNSYAVDFTKAVESITVPYWVLIAPLTLLSAYLLLSKPRFKRAV